MRPSHELARDIHISPFHLIRQFEAVFGSTPHQFRQASRLELARQLLASGQHSVTEVCMEVGFSSLGSFSDLFARRVGEPPSAYRRRLQPHVEIPGTPPPALIPGCLALMAHLPAAASSQFSRSEISPALSDFSALKERESDPAETQLAAAMQRIGELSMEIELLRAKMERSGPLARRRSR